jgi:hypothetical protein
MVRRRLLLFLTFYFHESISPVADVGSVVVESMTGSRFTDRLSSRARSFRLMRLLEKKANDRLPGLVCPIMVPSKFHHHFDTFSMASNINSRDKCSVAAFPDDVWELVAEFLWLNEASLDIQKCLSDLCKHVSVLDRHNSIRGALEESSLSSDLLSSFRVSSKNEITINHSSAVLSTEDKRGLPPMTKLECKKIHFNFSMQR